MSKKYTLSIVTYDRGTYDTTRAVKPYHWLFFIQVSIQGSKVLGIAHQLRGMPGAFYYPGPEDGDLAKSGSKKEELEIGEVEESKMDEVHAVLKDIRIDLVESSGWKCQDWSLDGLEQLKERGFVYEYMTRERKLAGRND